MKWLAQYLATDGKLEDWVVDPGGLIQKATLTFVDKFSWLLVRHRLLTTQADNIVTWDREVLVPGLLAKLGIEFARLLIAVNYERAFKTSTIYPFSCLIFQLRTNAGVLIWKCDTLHRPQGTYYISLIRDEANVAAARIGHRIEVPPLSVNLEDRVEWTQGSDPIAPEYADATPASSSPIACKDHYSSRSTPPSVTLIALARF